MPSCNGSFIFYPSADAAMRKMKRSFNWHLFVCSRKYPQRKSSGNEHLSGVSVCLPNECPGTLFDVSIHWAGIVAAEWGGLIKKVWGLSTNFPPQQTQKHRGASESWLFAVISVPISISFPGKSVEWRRRGENFCWYQSIKNLSGRKGRSR